MPSFFSSHRLRVVFCALFFVAWALPAPAADDLLVVHTAAGLVRGVARPFGGAEFLGIPYAEPPVGPLRWRAPVPAKHWSGIRDAKAFANSCAQALLGGAWNRHDAEHGSEDCLYLNVIVPEWPVKRPLPVMFWIHGGANLGGSGSGDLYTAGTLVDHGVLLVTINYRLGILGFFAHPALTRESPHSASGNWGLMDQILALRWVHDNIAAFGGDPANVTVFGQSAGAMDTGMLMASPLARNLFQKAIAESGVPLYPPPTPLDQAEQAGQQFAASFHNIQGTNPIEDLRQVPAQDLIAKASSREWGHAPVGPDIDGYVLPRDPAKVFKAGKEAPIPLLLGTTAREFGSSLPLDKLRKNIEDASGRYAQQALALYGLAGGGQGNDDPVYGSAGVQWGADVDFHCPATTIAIWHAGAHHPAYQYEFDHAIPGQEAQGALHSAELPYVFGNFPKSGNLAGSFGPIDTHLADLLQSYWTNFAKTGDPNGAGLPPWPQFDASQRYLTFTEDGQAVSNTGPFRGPQCGLYRDMLAIKLKHVE
jgi:para-nitrobenzyl esterase